MYENIAMLDFIVSMIIDDIMQHLDEMFSKIML